MNENAGLQTFAQGDIFVGATLLNNDEDDHAGRGRIIQYDADLNEKAVVWLDDTTHLVGGLNVAPDGVLWAFDMTAFKVLRFGPDGQRQDDFPAPKRALSHVNFAADGTYLFGEHQVGSETTVPLGTKLATVPGSDRFGDGHVFRVDASGNILHEYETDTHGGMGGFLGVTMSALSADGTTLYYVSETGPRLMRYDLENDRQLPDLFSFAPEDRQMFFGLTFDGEGRLLVARGDRVERITTEGEVENTYPLEGFGWALVVPTVDGDHFLAVNFFTGTVAKVALSSGETVATANTGVAKATAGITQYGE